jgi:hypothetical protein
MVVATITTVDLDAAGLDPCPLLESDDHRAQGVAVNGLPCKASACSTNCPPLGLVAGVAIDTLLPNS